jgi:formylmethanofuran dehydrogenase subunit A
MIDLCIRGGTVYDPANGVDGVVMDLWISGGRIVPAPPPSERPNKTIDARGLIVFPGGVDMHTHLAGPKVNAARGLQSEEKRNPRENGGVVPTTRWTGLKYAGLGFTTAVDAAVAPLFARQAHLELADTPIIDKAFLALVSDNHFVLDAVRDSDDDRLDNFLAWLATSVGAFGFKAVNPGGVEQWKETGRRTLVDLDAKIDHFKVSPREIVAALARSCDRLRLPHSLHTHCNNLGVGGNWKTTAATIDTVADARGHLAHIQFHSYDGAPDDNGSVASAVPNLVELVKKRSNVTVDVGHVTFGKTMALTGDGPLGHFLHKAIGAKWFSADVESEGGCGIVPVEYKHRSLFHSVQWAVGLEWYLLMDDPWRIGFSTDHPNGGAFWRYPETLALLMSRDLRREKMRDLHPDLPQRCSLMDIDREYSLYDVATLTRAAPARILGLKNKGHLGPGADADVVLYQPSDDPEKMLAFPRWVVKGGRVILDDGEIRDELPGSTFAAVPALRNIDDSSIRASFADNYSISFEHYGLRPNEREHFVTVSSEQSANVAERSVN